MTPTPQFTLDENPWDALTSTGELESYTAGEDGQLDTLLNLLDQHDVLTPPAALRRAALYLNHDTDNYMTVGILLRPEWPLIESAGQDPTRWVAQTTPRNGFGRSSTGGVVRSVGPRH